MPANVTLLRGAGSSRLAVYELEFRNRLAHGEGAIVWKLPSRNNYRRTGNYILCPGQCRPRRRRESSLRLSMQLHRAEYALLWRSDINNQRPGSSRGFCCDERYQPWYHRRASFPETNIIASPHSIRLLLHESSVYTAVWIDFQAYLHLLAWVASGFLRNFRDFVEFSKVHWRFTAFCESLTSFRKFCERRSSADIRRTWGNFVGFCGILRNFVQLAVNVSRISRKFCWILLNFSNPWEILWNFVVLYGSL